ncbi:dGTPase [Acetitomaculum ruminis DSM 5522]|uniref:Deoxyguanosinetriphosphate triphosphohydrolase-like protein n=1 Tax=Acetitomaculum ruminis DSM 5522 TaxID=1120918 RepID=A0A1I0VU01_9FIRM|nr:deoxyguanosinetriphosphate triphosphohydrolase [Acetitomaculum ruminis]SFA79782.1 dGTPase [Acetitomaculum ruminis DSM 5522]
MTIRESLENWEEEHLSPYASLSKNSRGRDREEEECDIRPAYQRDRDRILHSKAFRRLNNKTQVFLSPKGDHYRTRLTHTLEVSQIARTISKALRLNEDLTEAIALGHDLGHTPFGHCGESVLNEICKDGFKHNEQSVRIVEKIEKSGKGLNLTKEVRDGILNHQISSMPSTLEGMVVRLSDKIAYVNHDIDDAIRARVISEDDIPKEYKEILGNNFKQRLDTMIHSIIINSQDKNGIFIPKDVEWAISNLRKFMFENVYTNPIAKIEEPKAVNMLHKLFEFYLENEGSMPEHFEKHVLRGIDNRERIVCDYIAGMTDQYAISKFEDLFVPKSWNL